MRVARRSTYRGYRCTWQLRHERLRDAPQSPQSRSLWGEEGERHETTALRVCPLVGRFDLLPALGRRGLRSPRLATTRTFSSSRRHFIGTTRTDSNRARSISGTTPRNGITECPQAGLRDNKPKPLDRRRSTRRRRSEAGSDIRVNQDYSCMPQDETRSTSTRTRRGTSSPGRTTTASAGARRASTPRPTTASTGTTASRRSRRCRAGTTSTAAAIPAIVFDRSGVATTRRSTSTAPTTRAASG